MYHAGDRIIYVAEKHSGHPGPRAEAIQPETHGEGYWYQVKKFWTVLEVLPEGQLKVLTRRGKQRQVASDDPRLRPARWWEKLLYSSRFPSPEKAPPTMVPKRHEPVAGR
ncbi:MAG: hypothetical protein WEH44_01765 [Pirellulaceae bacterium]|jgi:hypothetical protein